METRPLRVKLQFGIYRIIDPFVRLLIKIGFTPNTVTVVGFILNVGVAVLFVVGAEKATGVIFLMLAGPVRWSCLPGCLICWTDK